MIVLSGERLISDFSLNNLVKIKSGSKVLSVQQFVTVSKNNVACIADLVLLPHVAHVKQLLIVESEQLSRAVGIDG